MAAHRRRIRSGRNSPRIRTGRMSPQTSRFARTGRPHRRGRGGLSLAALRRTDRSSRGGPAPRFRAAPCGRCGCGGPRQAVRSTAARSRRDARPAPTRRSRTLRSRGDAPVSAVSRSIFEADRRERSILRAAGACTLSRRRARSAAGPPARRTTCRSRRRRRHRDGTVRSLAEEGFPRPQTEVLVAGQIALLWPSSARRRAGRRG